MTIYPIKEVIEPLKVDTEYECFIEGCPPTTKINGYEVSIILSAGDKGIPQAHKPQVEDRVLVHVLSVTERNKSAVARYVRKL